MEGLEALTQLQDLWLNDNQIPSLDGLAEVRLQLLLLLPCCCRWGGACALQAAAEHSQALRSQRPTLTTIYLSGNPAAKESGYKQQLLALLPSLEQLDADVLPPRQ